MFAVIRVRGRPDVNVDIRKTMELLSLTRVNHCVVVPENDVVKGMLQKAKDYITWGEVSMDTLTKLIADRGRISGDLPLTDDYLKERSEFANASELAKAMIENDYKIRDIECAKPVFRLHPPAKGYEGNKRSYRNGGALGYRGDAINELIARML